jgi:hypothetical protein
MQLPRGYRNNNPGNIEDGPFASSLPGYIGSDGRFAQFADMDSGYGAMERLLTTAPYQRLGSITGAIGRWAPASDNNDPAAYAAYVARHAGVHPDDDTALSNPDVRAKMVRAMADYENGTRSAPSPMASAFTRRTDEGRKMADAPALSPSGITGALGALFSSPGLSDSMGRTALWLKSVDDPKLAEAAMQPRDDFSTMATPDGGMFLLNKKTGKVQQIMAPTPKPEKLGSGPLGDIMGVRVGRKYIDPMTGRTLFDPDQTSSDASGAVGGTGTGGQPTLYRPGLTQFDDSLQGPDRIAQYHPTIASDIMSMFHGDKMPVGKGDKYTQFISREARALGDAIGQPFTDQTFAQKRTMLNDMAKMSNSSAGGQALLALTALQHLGEVKGGFDEVHNRSFIPGLGRVPFGSDVAHIYNDLANSAAEYAPAKKGLEDATARYAEESSKYYAGSQAAQAERERIHSLYRSNLMPAEATEALRKERTLDEGQDRGADRQHRACARRASSSGHCTQEAAGRNASRLSIAS